MKASREQLINQFVAIAKDSAFGDVIRKSQAEYDALPGGISILIKAILDHRQRNYKHPDFAQIRELFFAAPYSFIS